mgnify:CR=1 FL=1
MAEFIEKKSSGNFVVLDRLQDPGNIGTIIRTADAAGYKLVIAMKGTADIFSPKVVRSATGSLFRVPIAFMENNDELIDFCAKAKKKLTATCLDDSKFYYEEDLEDNIALIVGNEGNGISTPIRNLLNERLLIPSYNLSDTAESLNVATATAIICSEFRRRF